MPNPATILGYGAIGLGFLLAYLAYRLLGKPGIPERQIYVFEVFCLALVIIGAILQYTDSGARAATQQKLLVALSRAQTAEAALSSAFKVMNGIAAMVDKSIANLNTVNGILTNGGACSGQHSGVPLPHGSEMAQLNSQVIANLAAAKSAIGGILPTK